jgi:peptide/nickel transport system permease protein
MKKIPQTLSTFLITMLLAFTLTFVMVHTVPGDPVTLITGEVGTVNVELLRAKLGLDQPLYIQYFKYLWHLVQGNLGASMRDGEPVLSMILEVLPYTLTLAGAALFLSATIGIPLGITAALHRNTRLDYVLMVTALSGICMPSFWIGIMLLLVFSLYLGVFPIIGVGSFSDYSFLRFLVLPAFALGFRSMGLVARMTRSSVLNVLQEPYVVTARSKGLAERIVIYKHVLRNALIPTLTMLGLDMGRLIAGSVIVETVFTRVGIGSLLVDGIYMRDYPVIQGTIIFVAFSIMIVNVLVDVVCEVMDPRIRA